MKTLIISSSLSPTSRSLILCTEVQKKLDEKGVQATLVNTSELNIQPCHKEQTEDMQKLAEKIDQADNIIFGMGVHCYSISDHLKIILDNCCKGAEGKFFGILCAAGGEKSYLATMHLTQICMNEFRMMQLPRVVYASKKSFGDGKLEDKDIFERIDQFVDEFFTVGKKLLQ